MPTFPLSGRVDGSILGARSSATTLLYLNSACLSDCRLKLDLLQTDFHADNRIAGNFAVLRFPGCRFDNQLDSFVAKSLFFAAAIADANQLLAITVEEFLCAFLIGNQCPSSLHKHHA